MARYLIPLLACLATGALASCGSSNSTMGVTSVSSSSTSGQGSAGKTSQAAVAGAGATVFASNCAQCHTLRAAGSSGQVGPNLDDLAPDKATVKAQVTNGGAGMPSFVDVLTDAQIDAVAAYVADSAGR